MPESELLDKIVSDPERQAFTLLPLMVNAESAAHRKDFALKLADLLGNPGEFEQYIESGIDAGQARLLKMFRENVELLVHKTWVENTEERPKEKLLDNLVTMERDFIEGAIPHAFLRFVSIARSIAVLLFGSAGRASDFILYAFRIDPKFGLFFWFVGELEKQARSFAEGPSAEELMRIEMLIGIYTLSSF